LFFHHSVEEVAMRKQLPVVLVPGLLCTARLYAEQIAALWTYGPVTVADHRRDDTMEAIARSILDTAPPRFALAGLSMGGYIALSILRLAPERVERLALLDTSARSDSPQQTERRRAQIALAQSGRFAEVVHLLWPIFVHRDRQGDAELHGIVRTIAVETGHETFIRQQHAIMTRPDARSMLGSIDCPTLVLVGDGDQLTPPELSQEIAASIVGARLVAVPNCGHLSTLERPAAVNRALAEWMDA
jgi:pimeloyl-ACP methyl ester carboxylesterase